MKAVFTSIGLVFIAIIVMVTMVAGYLGGWWIREDIVDRTAEIRRGQFEVQETARDEVIRQAAEIEKISVDIANPNITDDQRRALEGQRMAAARQLCNVASDISGSITSMVDAVIAQYCN